MIRTRVGYTGGTSKNPTYYNLGQHTESLQIDYDPAVISYADLLKMFWGTHNACRQAYSRQYMSAIFYHNEEQKKLATQTRDTKAQLSGKVFTEILPLETFYLAEDYHQKYYLQQNDLLTQEFRTMYPDIDGFVNSTAAARVNGYFGRHGDRKTFDSEAKRYGLSDESIAYIERYVRK